MWSLGIVIPEPERLRQTDHKFPGSLLYMENLVSMLYRVKHCFNPSKSNKLQEKMGQTSLPFILNLDMPSKKKINEISSY